MHLADSFIRRDLQ